MSDKKERLDDQEIPEDVRKAFTFAITYLENFGEGSIVNDMDVYLNHYTVPQLKDIAKTQGLRKLSRYRKKELIDLVHSALADEETLTKKMLRLSDLGYNALTKKVFKEKTLSVHELAALDDLDYYGYIMMSDNGLVFISQEVMDLMKKIIRKNDFQLKRKKIAFMHALIRFADYLYSVIDENFMKMMYQSRFKNVSDEEFMRIYREIENPVMIYKDHEFISRTVIEQDAYDIVKKIQSRHVMSLLGSDEIEDFMNYGYPYSNGYYKVFYLLLTTLFYLEPLEAAFVVRHVFGQITTDARLNEILDYIIGYIDDLNDDQLDILLKCIMDMSNDSRHFETYGNVPTKLAVDRLKSGGSIRLPDDEGFRKAMEEHRQEINDLGYDFDDDGNIFLKDDDQDDDSNNFYS